MTISRRTFLRGTGVTLGLPLLEAMRPAALYGAPALAAPKRIAFLYVPNGIVHDAWKPVSEGHDYALPSSLEPLTPVKSEVLVLTGLSQIPYGERAGVGHARPTTAWLTGTVADKQGVRAGKSVDQILADEVGSSSRFPSLQLSVAGTQLNGQCDSGYSCAYSSCISWRDETRPMPNDNNARSVFQRLFGEPAAAPRPEERSQQAAIRKSVLDRVLDDARQLHNRLGKSDQRKLDEYLYSVRQLERRVDAVVPTLADGRPVDFRLPDEAPHDYSEHVRLMGDLLVLAFQTDVTRVATLMFGVAASEQTYPMIGVREGHHELSHHGGDEEKIARLRKIDRFNVSLYAYLLSRMKAISEGDGSLLDNSLVIYGSGLGNGNAHTPYDLPLLIGGRAGGQIKTGRHIRYPLDTPLNNLWLTVLSAMGSPLPRFGNSTGLLPKLDG